MTYKKFKMVYLNALQHYNAMIAYVRYTHEHGTQKQYLDAVKRAGDAQAKLSKLEVEGSMQGYIK